jgi:hypothetical protein
MVTSLHKPRFYQCLYVVDAAAHDVAAVESLVLATSDNRAKNRAESSI